MQVIVCVWNNKLPPWCVCEVKPRGCSRTPEYNQLSHRDGRVREKERKTEMEGGGDKAAHINTCKQLNLIQDPNLEAQ